MTDSTLIAAVRKRYPWLSDEWEAAVRLELGKRSAAKCRRHLETLRDLPDETPEKRKRKR
jgi:hypothetical protein